MFWLKQHPQAITSLTSTRYDGFLWVGSNESSNHQRCKFGSHAKFPQPSEWTRWCIKPVTMIKNFTTLCAYQTFPIHVGPSLLRTNNQKYIPKTFTWKHQLGWLVSTIFQRRWALGVWRLGRKSNWHRKLKQLQLQTPTKNTRFASLKYKSFGCFQFFFERTVSLFREVFRFEI